MHQSGFPQAMYFVIGTAKIWTNSEVVQDKIFFPIKTLVLRTVPWSRCSVTCFYVTAPLWLLYGQVEVTKHPSISLFNCKVLLMMTRKYVKCKSIFNLHVCTVKPQQVSFESCGLFLILNFRHAEILLFFPTQTTSFDHTNCSPTQELTSHFRIVWLRYVFCAFSGLHIGYLCADIRINLPVNFSCYSSDFIRVTR